MAGTAIELHVLIQATPGKMLFDLMEGLKIVEMSPKSDIMAQADSFPPKLRRNIGCGLHTAIK